MNNDFSESNHHVSAATGCFCRFCHPQYPAFVGWSNGLNKLHFEHIKCIRHHNAHCSQRLQTVRALDSVDMYIGISAFNYPYFSMSYKSAPKVRLIGEICTWITTKHISKNVNSNCVISFPLHSTSFFKTPSIAMLLVTWTLSQFCSFLQKHISQCWLRFCFF